jgi:polyisoprenoid-binding protein YceI
MFKKLFSISMIAVLWITAYGTMSGVPMAVDTNHSNVGFRVPIAGGLAQVTGKFSSFTVNLNFDEKDITKSTVEATIKADSISTGIAGRDTHLKTADFFDVAKYPEITFKSKKIEKKGKSYMLTGDFTMHGVTKEISFPFVMVGNCYDKKAAKATLPCGFSANLKLDRRDYGITYARKDNADFIGNIIDIDLNMLAVQPRPARQ